MGMTNPLAILCVIGSCISLQLGAALAVQLFDDGGTWGTAALRLLMAAAVLLLISRPKVRTWGREQWLTAAALGLSLGMMNGFFYAAIARIPIGPAVTIEFIGPLLLAAFLSRSLRDAVCVALAVFGLGLLGWDSLTGEPLDPIGVGLVLVAGACWVAYILASKKAGSLFSGQDGLAVALAIGGIALLPMGGQGAVVLVSDSHLLLLAFGTGLLASLIPYSLEITALRSLNPNVFSILVALEPVFAAFFGWLLLSQNLSPLKLLAIALVIMASVLQTMVPDRGTKPKLRRVPWKAHRRSRAKVG